MMFFSLYGQPGMPGFIAQASCMRLACSISCSAPPRFSSQLSCRSTSGSYRSPGLRAGVGGDVGGGVGVGVK
eukprot:1378848-Rhodomonas_salina.2